MGGKPSGRCATAPKSRTPKRPSGVIRKLPGWGSACSSPARARRREQEAQVVQPGLVALLLRPIGDDPRQRSALEPLGDDHGVPGAQDIGDDDVGVVAEGCGEGALGGGLLLVVQLLLDPLGELGQQRLEVHAGDPGGHQPGQPRGVGQVGHQRLVRTRVLDLHGDGSAVLPDCPVHLADARCRRGLVVEGLELAAPLLAEVRRPAPRAPSRPAARAPAPAAWSGSRGRARPRPRAGPPRRCSSPGRPSSPRP